MFRKLSNIILRRDLELRERIFRMVLIIGTVLASLSLLEVIFLVNEVSEWIMVFMLVLVFAICLFLTFQLHRYEIATCILGFFLLVIVFPIAFLQNGALSSGAPIWLAIGFFSVFILYEGPLQVFFLVVTILADATVYYIAYKHPETLPSLSSRQVEYLDSFFGVCAVGIGGGLFFKIQTKINSVEREITEKQKEEIVEISASKNNFFASMSHEIRTPINTIIGLNEMILRQSKEVETLENAHDIQNASKMLLNLVNDILDLSQMEINKMEIVPVEYETRQLFQEIISMIQVRLSEKHLELFVDVDKNLPKVLLGDARRIQQVLLNILTNSAKYTQEGSVTLTIQSVRTRPGEMQLKVSIADTGIGIRKEDLEHLYDSFKRVDVKSNHRIEGSGLGLAITKQLVNLMDGEISVDSIYTRGTTFTVVIPQTVVDATPIGAISVRSRQSLGEEYQKSFEAPEARILIVDDNEMNTKVIGKLLSDTKVQIDVAYSGKECLQLTKRKYYHIILMDYMMPEMNGAESLKAIRKQENGLCKESAIIILSASSKAENNRIYLESGFDGYLEKPIQSELLEKTILSFLPEDVIEYRASGEEEVDVKQISLAKRNRVRICSDCVSDLPNDMIEKYNISILPLYIRTSKGRFSDTVEIDSADLTEYLSNPDEEVSTDIVPVEEFESFYANNLSEAEDVIYISLASRAGRTYDVAMAAAKGFDHVHVIDSTTLSCGEGIIVLYAAKLAAEGKPVADIINEIDKMKRQVVTAFISPNTELLSIKGYLGSGLGKVMNRLQLHPVLRMKKSRLTICGYYRGNMNTAYRKFVRNQLLMESKINVRNRVFLDSKIHTGILSITHAGLSVYQLEVITNEIKKYVSFDQIIIQKASVSMTCNSGLGSLGIAYFRKEKDS